ncbi:MAG: metallophosphoesterase [Candidatus Micrarchaeota archaeon]|nr:metallophosphoesterase [Candidatus Micrarchaeota archaeon]
MEKGEKDVLLLFDYDSIYFQRLLILTDLHLGIGEELGLRHKIVSEVILEKLTKCIRYLEKKKLLIEGIVILGDVKHSINVIDDEIFSFFDDLSSVLDKDSKVFIIKGNHDGNLHRIQKVFKNKMNLEFFSSSGFSLKYSSEKSAYFFHGNSYPKVEFIFADKIFMGHLHPALRFSNITKKCFVVCDNVKFDKEFLLKRYVKHRDKIEQYLKDRAIFSHKIYILPSFNPFIDGKTSFFKDSVFLNNVYKHIGINLYSTDFVDIKFFEKKN